jgi:hypothetical protein
MELDAFAIVAEFGVALAGFSGIVVAVKHRDEGFAPLDRYRIFTMLFYAIIAAFGSLAPIGLVLAGMEDVQLWFWTSTFTSLLLAGALMATLVGMRWLTRAERAKLSPLMWIAVVGGDIGLIVGLCLTSVFGATALLPFVALVWQLILSSILFLRLLVNDQGRVGQGD